MVARNNRDWDERGIYFQYLEEISTYPLLEPAHERQLLELAARGSKGAMDKLVTHNLKFVVNIANLYRGQGLELGELVNEGNLGLIEAARRFDPNQKIKFISYAVWWIRQGITRAIAEKARIVRISAEKELVLRRLHKAGGTMKQVVGGQMVVDPESLVGITQYGAKQIEKILIMGLRSSSLDTPVGEDGDSTLVDITADDGDPTDLAAEQSSQNEMVAEMLSSLTDQERKVITMYFGLEGQPELNLLEIGKVIGLSKERVRQLKESALATLRAQGVLQELLPAA